MKSVRFQTLKRAPTEADAVLCYNPSKGDCVPYERSSVGGASVLLLAIAWTTPGFARVECKGDFQVTKYGLIATPYCEEENIAVVAQSYGWQVTGSQVPSKRSTSAKC